MECNRKTKAVKNFLRVDHELFQELVSCVGPPLQAADTIMVKSLEPDMHLVITLRYLAAGNSPMSVLYSADLDSIIAPLA